MAGGPVTGLRRPAPGRTRLHRRSALSDPRLAVFFVLLLLLADPAAGARTTPDLTLTRVVVERGEAASLLRLEGNFPSGDLVRLRYPIQILVRDVERGGFVRLPVPGGAFTGILDDPHAKLDPDLAVELLWSTTPEPDARVVLVGAGVVEVLLPSTFPTTDIEAQVFVVRHYDGETVVVISNPLPAEDGSGS